MKSLIIGNSQAEGAGAILEGVLKKKGYTVKRLAKHGAVTKDLLALYDTVQHPDYDLIVVFCGDPDNTGKLLDKFTGNPQVVWYGSAPATTITNVSLAKKVFGSKIKNANTWFENGYAKQREDNNIKMQAVLPQSVKHIDYRDIELPNSVEQKSNVSFPDLPDGIHITTAIAKSMFAAPNWPEATQSDLATVPSWVWWATGAATAFTFAWWLFARSRR